MFKIKLTGDIKGIEREVEFAETCLDHLDERFVVATFHNMSDSMLSEIIEAAKREKGRRHTIARLNREFTELIYDARDAGVDLLDMETGEVLTDKSFTFS